MITLGHKQHTQPSSAVQEGFCAEKGHYRWPEHVWEHCWHLSQAGGNQQNQSLTNPNTKLPSLQHKFFLKFNLISRLRNELWPGFNSQWKYSTSQSHSPVYASTQDMGHRKHKHPTLNTWRIVSLLKVPTIHQAQALSQGCEALKQRKNRKCRAIKQDLNSKDAPLIQTGKRTGEHWEALQAALGRDNIT